MTDKVINLRRRRKDRARQERKAEADRNAARHGLSKAASDLARAREEKRRRLLEQHRLDDQDES